MTIVSANPETLDGFEAYLRRAGFSTNGTRSVDAAPEVTPAACSAIIVFPDDFSEDAVLGALDVLRERRPSTLPVLVTREPKRFERVAWPARGPVPVVVPKPVWGWSILDAIRAHLEPEADGG